MLPQHISTGTTTGLFFLSSETWTQPPISIVISDFLNFLVCKAPKTGIKKKATVLIIAHYAICDGQSKNVDMDVWGDMERQDKKTSRKMMEVVWRCHKMTTGTCL